MRQGWPIGALVLAFALLVGACGAPDEGRGAAVSPEGQADPAAPTPDEEAAYHCFGVAFPRSAWSEQQSTEQARDHPGWQHLVENLGGEGLEGWFLLEETDERLAVARHRDVVLEAGDDRMRTHDVVSVRWFDTAGRWHLEQSSSCTPKLVVDGVGPAEVWLDGEPDPTAATLDLLVVETACASGERADGRVRVVSLEEHDDRVEIIIGVEPAGGAQNCPSNPPTPFRIDLDDPVADREIIDSSAYPPQPMRPPPDDPHLD